MARPSDLESQPVFAQKTGVVFALGVGLFFAPRQLSTETARFY
ncbi:MAG: hypothetical protein P4L91_19465 [Burkholderiaceae bacterium]|nr:hypothetical protein [Burkholderiaceae bacterium]